MSKIKSVSQFEDGIWGTETPIGADASNVDVEMSDSSTKDLQTVLGDIPSAAAPIQSQINTKVTASGGNIGNTTVSSGIQNFDSSSSETSTELLDTSVRVTNATEVTSSMWTKFNRFRKRVDNKFKDVFLSSVEDVASPSDYKTYSQSALNDYFANVVGYASASDLPDATSTIAQQLSTLNNKTLDYNHIPYDTLVWGSTTYYNVSNVSVKQIYNLFLINFLLNIIGTTSDFTKIPLLRLPTHKLSGPQFSNVIAYGNTSGAFSSIFPYGASSAVFGDRDYLTQYIMFSAYPGYKIGLTCIIVGEPGYGWD